MYPFTRHFQSAELKGTACNESLMGALSREIGDLTAADSHDEIVSVRPTLAAQEHSSQAATVDALYIFTSKATPKPTTIVVSRYSAIVYYINKTCPHSAKILTTRAPGVAVVTGHQIKNERAHIKGKLIIDTPT